MIITFRQQKSLQLHLLTRTPESSPAPSSEQSRSEVYRRMLLTKHMVPQEQRNMWIRELRRHFTSHLPMTPATDPSLISKQMWSSLSQDTLILSYFTPILLLTNILPYQKQNCFINKAYFLPSFFIKSCEENVLQCNNMKWVWSHAPELLQISVGKKLDSRLGRDPIEFPKLLSLRIHTFIPYPQCSPYKA